MTKCTFFLDRPALVGEEARVPSAFTHRLREIAALSRSEPIPFSSNNALNMLSGPAILLDLDGFAIGVNDAAVAIFNGDVGLTDRRLFIRDIEARARFHACAAELNTTPDPFAPRLDPLIVPRRDNLPILLRIWPINPPARWPTPEVRALVTLDPLGPKPGPPAPILTKAFGLTPSEAKLACIIARGAGPGIASQELKISRETARNQLKSIFAKTRTHRQSELVALLLQLH